MAHWFEFLSIEMERDLWNNFVRKGHNIPGLCNIYHMTAEKAVAMIRREHEQILVGKTQANRYVSAILNADRKAKAGETPFTQKLFNKEPNMPSSEDYISAQAEVKEWAIKQLIKEGHEKGSAEMIVNYMSYEQRVECAEKFHGPIYRGAYSPY